MDERSASLIDLGELSDEPTRPAPGRMPPRTRRGLLLSAIVLACTLVTAASAPGRPALSGPLWAGEVSLAGFSLGTRNVYSFAPDGRTAVARDLSTGRVRWRVNLTGLPQFTLEVEPGVAAVVSRARRDQPGLEGSLLTTLVDDETGAIIAREAGRPFAMTRSGWLLLESGSRSDPGVGCRARVSWCTDVTAWDPAARARVWQRGLSGYLIDDSGPMAPPVNRLVTIEASTALVWDAGSGRQTGRIELNWVDGSTGFRAVARVGDLLVAGVRVRDRAQVTAYALADGAKIWSSTVSGLPSSDIGDQWMSFAGCGRLLCLHLPRADAIIDPVGGSVRAVVPFTVLLQLDNGLLVATLAEGLDAYRYESDDSTAANSLVYLLDPRTGVRRSTIAVSQVLGWPSGGDRLVLARPGTRGTAVFLLTPAGEPVLLGSVSGTALDCQARARFLACGDPAGGLRLWRLPR